MSYFEVYFNPWGEKTLRSYSRPFRLARFDAENWMTTDKDLEYIGDALDCAPHIRVMTPRMIRALGPADADLVKAGLLGANPSGLFKPRPKPGIG